MIVLFKKGTGEARRFNEFGFESSLDSGWCLTKDEALKPDILKPVELPTSSDGESIRKQAKEKGIPHYWTKSIERLKQELADDSES